MRPNGRMLFLKRTDLPVPGQYLEPLTPSSDNIFDVDAPRPHRKAVLSKYDILGDLSFKESYLEKSLALPSIGNSQVTQTISSSNQSFNSATSGISTSKRLSLKNCTVKELQEVSKDQRNLEKLEWYNKHWAGGTDRRRRKKTHRIRVVEEPNPEKDEVVKQNYKLYWEKSLRNHDLGILKHLEGAPFDVKELKTSLQTIEGTRKVQRTIPKLPTTKRKEGFTLRGRNKSEIINLNEGFGRAGRAYSVEEVLKSHWDSGLSKLYNV